MGAGLKLAWIMLSFIALFKAAHSRLFRLLSHHPVISSEGSKQGELLIESIVRIQGLALLLILRLCVYACECRCFSCPLCGLEIRLITPCDCRRCLSEQHADALLSAQEANGPRHGIRAFQDAR